jgi:hypothetical protein
MRAFLQSLLAVLTLGMVPMGCSKQPGPGAPAPSAGPPDVTLLVPGMN